MTTCTRLLELQNGRKLTAVQVQAEYLDIAMRYVEEREVPEWAPGIVRDWAEVVDHLDAMLR